MAPVGRLHGGWLQAYYLATPVFFLGDVVLGASVRAAFLPEPGPRYLYYLFCMGCAFACSRWPRAAPWVGMAESAMALFLLILGIMLPILDLPDAILAGEPAGFEMGAGRILNFLISGGVLWFSFQRNVAAAAARTPASR